MHRRPIIHPRPVSNIGRAVVGAVVVGAVAHSLVHPRPMSHHMPPRPHHGPHHGPSRGPGGNHRR